MRRSGIQTEVLHLYRRALRIPHSKPPATRDKFYLLIRSTLRATAASVSNPRDVNTIEYLMRRSTRLIEGWEDPSVRDCVIGGEVGKLGSGRRFRTKTRGE